MKIYHLNLLKAQLAVSEHFDIPVSVLFKKNRNRGVVYARHLFHYLGHRYLKIPSNYVGDHSGRDHSTVLHSCRQIDDWGTYDKNVIEDLKELKKRVDRNNKWFMLKRLVKEFWNNFFKILSS